MALTGIGRVTRLAYQDVMSSETPPRKKTGPAPTGKGQQVQVRLRAHDLEMIGKWIAQQPDPKPSRPEAIRKLMRLGIVYD